MNHLMIDTETLSCADDAVIFAMAAVVFNEDKILQQFYWHLNIPQQILDGRTIDEETLEFWKDRRDVFNLLTEHKDHLLQDVLMDLGKEIHNYDIKQIWAKSPSFDLRKLEHAIHHQLKITTPWTFAMEQDVRTVYLLLKQHGFPIIKPDNPHDPLSDCMAQVFNVQTLLQPIQRKFKAGVV